ncbi:hypothetical protein RP20_CCG014717 [Aedes albopictus]|nr:hypothetical protein RP20_CCG014717 [Aedes albopictus]
MQLHRTKPAKLAAGFASRCIGSLRVRMSGKKFVIRWQKEQPQTGSTVTDQEAAGVAIARNPSGEPSVGKIPPRRSWYKQPLRSRNVKAENATFDQVGHP